MVVDYWNGMLKLGLMKMVRWNFSLWNHVLKLSVEINNYADIVSFDEIWGFYIYLSLWKISFSKLDSYYCSKRQRCILCMYSSSSHVASRSVSLDHWTLMYDIDFRLKYISNVSSMRIGISSYYRFSFRLSWTTKGLISSTWLE